MKIRIDTHTHSIASVHAYSTIDELALGARKAGLQGFVLTEHGPQLQNAPHPYFFGNLRALPGKIHGVFVFRGVELNIIDMAGDVDLSAAELSGLHFCMAGLHEGCFNPGNKKNNTAAIVAALKNPYVDAISHPANPAFPADYEEIVDTAAAWGKALEINNSSFRVRQGSDKTCPVLARLCAEKHALVCIGSDAHHHTAVGSFKTALAVIKEAGINPDQIINRNLKTFFDFIEERHGTRSAGGSHPLRG